MHYGNTNCILTCAVSKHVPTLFIYIHRVGIKLNVKWESYWGKKGFVHLPSTGLQLRKSEQNGFQNANFLISQPNPMMWPSLKSSLRDDSNEWSHHRVWLRNKKVSILKNINFRLYLLPCLNCSPGLTLSAASRGRHWGLSDNLDKGGEPSPAVSACGASQREPGKQWRPSQLR